MSRSARSSSSLIGSRTTCPPKQLAYAAGDVTHLLDLADRLFTMCTRTGLGPLLVDSFEYLPTLVELDMRGSGDVFSY